MLKFYRLMYFSYSHFLDFDFCFVCTYNHRFHQCTCKKRFETLVQSAAIARRRGRGNQFSSVFSQLMRIVAIRPFGSQEMD